MKTVTNAQMTWMLKRGFAWWEQSADGEVYDDWRMPIWTKEGAYIWDTTAQVYELVIT